MMFTSMDTYAGQELCPRCGEDEAGDSWPHCSDGHPHDETCTRKRYSEEVCDRCERELNTQLPTSVELCGKSKWEVERHPVNAGSAEHVWCAFHSEEDIEETHRHFPTWREAMDYADQRARTHEVTLPRVEYGDHVVAGKGLYSLHVEYVKHMTSIYLGGWEGAHIPNSQLWDLAVYLAACAQHWEEKCGK